MTSCHFRTVVSNLNNRFYHKQSRSTAILYISKKEGCIWPVREVMTKWRVFVEIYLKIEGSNRLLKIKLYGVGPSSTAYTNNKREIVGKGTPIIFLNTFEAPSFHICWDFCLFSALCSLIYRINTLVSKYRMKSAI